jgi:hypothetical protein
MPAFAFFEMRPVREISFYTVATGAGLPYQEVVATLVLHEDTYHDAEIYLAKHYHPDRKFRYMGQVQHYLGTLDLTTGPDGFSTRPPVPVPCDKSAGQERECYCRGCADYRRDVLRVMQDSRAANPCRRAAEKGGK